MYQLLRQTQSNLAIMYQYKSKQFFKSVNLVRPVQSTQARGANSCTGPLTLDWDARWRWAVNIMLWPLYSNKKKPSTHWTEGWVGPRAGLDNLRKRKISCIWREPNYIPPKSVREV